MDAQGIMQYIPHRYPFLYVDQILEREGTDYAIGVKNVSQNDPYLHREPGQKARLPESILVECMSQVGAVATLSLPEHRGKIMLFACVDDVKIHSPVYAGDSLITRVERVFLKSGIGKMRAVAKVDDKLVAEGLLSFALADGVPAAER